MKAVILFVLYLVFWQIISPISTYIPGLQSMIQTFVIIYMTLMVIGDLTSGTIYQHFFNAAKALFVIAYLMFSLQGGIYEVSFQTLSFLVDIRLFLVVAMILGLFGFARSVLQAINFVNEKAEPVLL